MGESSGCGSANAVATLFMLGNGNGSPGGILTNGSLSGLGLIGNVGMMKSAESKSDYGGSLNRSPSSQSGQNGCHSPTSSSISQPQYSAEYLAQLLKDKKQLGAFPNIFVHLERLVDDEINKVRVSLFHLDTNKEAMVLPEADGPVVTLQEKVYVPIKDHPEYNFVGRILGPRGMTAKQLEQETGCKVMVRGKGSMRDKKKEDQNRGKPNWEHLSDELHVLIQCEDSENRAKIKLMRAVEEVKKLLVPAPEGEDELKRKQLMELAIINGTYRPANQNKIAMHTPRLLAPMTLTASPLRSPTLGAPIILSPTRVGGGATATTPLTPNGFSAATAANVQSFMASTPDFAAAAAAAAGLLYNPLDPTMSALAGSLSGCYPYSIASPLLAAGDYGAFDMQAGAILNQRRILGQIRDHPYQRPSLKTPTL